MTRKYLSKKQKQKQKNTQLAHPVSCLPESCIEVPQRSENKNLTQFFLFVQDWDGKG